MGVNPDPLQCYVPETWFNTCYVEGYRHSIVTLLVYLKNEKCDYEISAAQSRAKTHAWTEANAWTGSPPDAEAQAKT